MDNSPSSSNLIRKPVAGVRIQVAAQLVRCHLEVDCRRDCDDVIRRRNRAFNPIKPSGNMRLAHLRAGQVLADAGSQRHLTAGQFNGAQ